MLGTMQSILQLVRRDALRVLEEMLELEPVKSAQEEPTPALIQMLAETVELYRTV